MLTVTFIGAGSIVFAKKLISDILSFPDLSNSTLILMDVDEARLAKTMAVAEAMVENAGLDATIKSTTDRREALRDTDYVLNMVNVGGSEPFENEIRIPERYGVEQAIGDTHGPGGIFRGLRTIPTMLDIAADMEELCPDAILMNYTNPMAILCQAMYEATDIETVGLCHSIPHTIQAIADYIGAPTAELNHWVAGINHLAWVLDCEWDGQDIYPLLKDAMEVEDTYRRDTVRFEMLRHFGAFPTESSHHVSEYLPYFRTNEETIDAMAGTDYAERMATATYFEGWTARSEERDDPSLDIDHDEVTVERSEEYAARLIHSLETGESRRFNLNVSNESGMISNLPRTACVEVPCLADGSGIHPCAVGELPTQLAALCRAHTSVHELAVTASLSGDREALHRAIQLDPLTAATLTLPKIHEMTEELIEANAAYLPKFE
jgi:alpha-galactosidase